jgi:hypothetical protein
MMLYLLLALAFLASPAYAEASAIDQRECLGTWHDSAGPPPERCACLRDKDTWQCGILGPYAFGQVATPVESWAGARSGYHDDECREIRECVKARPCIESDWRWFAARNRSCEPADESTQRAFLCYLDGLGQPQRWKMLRFMPLAEASFEAQMRNQAQCGGGR